MDFVSHLSALRISISNAEKCFCILKMLYHYEASCGSWSPFYLSLNLMHARLLLLLQRILLRAIINSCTIINSQSYIYDRRCDSSTKDWVNKVWVQLTHHLKVRVTDGNLLTRLGARDVIASKNVFETLSIESQLRVLDKAGLVKVLERYRVFFLHWYPPP